MLSHRLFNLTIILYCLLLSGCILNSTDKAVIDAKNASFPLKNGTYYGFKRITSGYDKKFITRHTTVTVRELIATNPNVPDMSNPITITRLKHCYVGKEEGDKDEKNVAFYVFEKLEGNIYLMSIQAECLNRGEKTNTSTWMITIKESEIYGMYMESSALDKSYNKWALSLNKFNRWTNGVYISEDKPQNSSTKSYQTFYNQNKELIIAAEEAFFTSLSNLNKYKPGLIINGSLRIQFEKEQNKTEVEKPKIVEKEKIFNAKRWLF